MIRIRSVGVLIALTIGVGIWVGCVPIPTVAGLSTGITRPVLGMELARSRDDLVLLIGDTGSKNRDLFFESMRRDFWFIALYSASFIAIALVLPSRLRGRWAARCFSLSAVVLAIAAACMDIQENYGIF